MTLSFPEPVVQEVLGNTEYYDLAEISSTRYVLTAKSAAPRSNCNMETCLATW